MIRNYELIVVGLVVLICGLLIKSTQFGKLMVAVGAICAGYIGYQQKTLYAQKKTNTPQLEAK